LQEEVLFDLADAYTDWQVFRDPYEEGEVQKQDCTFIVMKKSAVQFYLNALQKCKLKPVCLTTGALAYSQILRAAVPGGGPAAVLDLDYQQATLCFLVNNRIHFARNMPVSWEKITQSLTEILVSDKGKIELSAQEAEEIKNTVGYPLGHYDENLQIRDNVQVKHVVSMLRPILEVLVRELNFSFDYYATNFNVEPPRVLYITGGGANLKRFEEYLHQELGIEVSCLPVPPQIDLHAAPELEGARPRIPGAAPKETVPEAKGPESREDENSARRNKIINALGAKQVLQPEPERATGFEGFGSVLGLSSSATPPRGLPVSFNEITTLLGIGLSDIKGVNLLPPEVKRQKAEELEKTIFRVGIITATAIVAIMMLITRLQIRDYAARLRTAHIHLSVIREVEDTKNQIQDNDSFIGRIRDGRIPWNGVLLAMASVLPREMVLNRLGLSQGTGQLTLEGTVAASEDMSEQILTRYMQELEATPFFKEANLVSVEGVGRLQKFKITCDLVK
jgi:Tfp pilus assembly protein PilN